MWPHTHTRILAALILFQVTMFGYFGVKKFYFAPILLPLPILSLVFAFVCRKKFYKFFQSNALEVSCHELKETPNMEYIFKSFIPQCLSTEKSDEEEQHEDAISQFSRTASFVWSTFYNFPTCVFSFIFFFSFSFDLKVCGCAAWTNSSLVCWYFVLRSHVLM